jgi:hypothetical protein
LHPGIPALPKYSIDLFRKVEMHTTALHVTPILEYLKKHGQQIDREIAAATGISLPEIRATLSALSAKGEISLCSITTFADGVPVEGMLCRIAGTIPQKAPGRKPGTPV